MNFEAGKFYRTRDGKKVEVIAFTPLKPDDDGNVGVAAGEGCIFCFKPDGSTLRDGVKMPNDLIEEWPPPLQTHSLD